MFEFSANSVDSDQMPHFAASDLGQHCLAMSLLWDASLEWINLRELGRLGRFSLSSYKGDIFCI